MMAGEQPVPGTASGVADRVYGFRELLRPAVKPVDIADLISAALVLMRLLGWQAVALRTRYRRGIARLVFSMCSPRARPTNART